MATLAKQTGLVLTPSPVAHELAGWAIQRPNDTVLDIGAGEGVFLEEAVNRLRGLGCTNNEVQLQVFGVERNPELYGAACRRVEGTFHFSLPNFVLGDLFDSSFPPISAVLGNPPYVRRNTLDEIDRIRERVIYHNLFLARLPRLTDSTQDGLNAQISNAMTSWRQGQFSIYQSRLPAAEADAYSVSDPIAPMYAYQSTCAGNSI